MKNQDSINFLRGLYSVIALDDKFVLEIDRLKNYYLEKSIAKNKNDLINSVFEEKFDLVQAKNNFDEETKELFFNLLILLAEIQLNQEKKYELVNEYADDLEFKKNNVISITEEVKKELAKNLDFTPFNWLCRMIKGYINFKETGISNIESYYSFRLLHFLTNNRINKLMGLISEVFNSYDNYEFSKDNIFSEEYDEALKALKEDGVYVFKNKLPPELIESAYDFAINTKCYPVPSEKNYEDCFKEDGVLFPEEKTYQAARYDHKTSEIVNDSSFFKILDKCKFTDFARKFFNSKALLDVIRLWWTTPIRDRFDKYTGQVFHIDIDRAVGILFIIYLTDVTEENGPHVYVKGSHKSKPLHLLQDRRMVPEDIENNYPKEDIIKIMAEKGTILAIDPLGLHRGQPLNSDNRLALKYQFSNDGFGEPLGFYKITDDKTKEKIKQMQQEYDFTFSRFLI